MKFKHNKKRNVAFIYEALIRELTVASLNKQFEKKKKIEETIKKLFSKNSVLGKQLKLYKTLLETRGVDYITAEKILYEVHRVYSTFDKKEVYDAQTTAIHHINHEITPQVFAKFVPNYKSLATMYNLFHTDQLDIKDKVLLERKIVERMISDEETPEPKKKPIDKFVVQTFAKNFNDTYGDLLEEQRKLLSKFVASSFEDDTDLKIYINEELGRIREKIVNSHSLKEIKEDKIMLENSEKVLHMVDSFKNKKSLDENDLILLLKMQQLIKEIES